MATGYLSAGSTVYCRPNSSSSIGTTMSGKTVDILWEESNSDYYYVDIPTNTVYPSYINNRIQAYVLKTRVTGIIGTFPLFSFTPATRYLGDETTAWYGPGGSYGIAPAPIFPQGVTYSGKADDTYAFIEYTANGVTRRAWVERNKLVTVQLLPWKYVVNQSINSSADKWFTGGNMWNSDQIHPGHMGIDMRRKSSTGVVLTGRPIYAIATGTVVAASGDDNANGRCVIIEHTTSTGKKYYSYYCHLQSISVSIGYTISVRGQAIGIMGNSNGPDGAAMVDHVHISITKTNVGTGFFGYNRDVNGNYATMTSGGITPDYYDMNCHIPSLNTRYYNPTAYFAQGEALINNNYT